MSSKNMYESESKEVKEIVSPCSMHPDSYLFKTIGLIFICSIGFGSYFCYDIPGALEVIKHNVFSKWYKLRLYNTYVLWLSG